MLMRAQSQPSLYRQGKEIKIGVHKYFSIFLFSFGLFIWLGPIKHPTNIHQMYSAVSIGPSNMESPTGFSQALLQTVFPHVSLNAHSKR